MLEHPHMGIKGLLCKELVPEPSVQLEKGFAPPKFAPGSGQGSMELFPASQSPGLASKGQ